MNAIHHNPPETTIQVTTELKEDRLLIVIQDNGTGMDQKTIQHLFDRYYRGTPTDRTALGSGLGMVIAKQFIERMQGSSKWKASGMKAPGSLFGFHIKIKVLLRLCLSGVYFGLLNCV